MHDVTRTEGRPPNRLGRIGDAMTKTFDAHPELRGDDKCIVFLDANDQGGIVMSGWDDDTEAMAALFVHLQAIFRANGRDLQFVGIPNDASGLTGP